MKNLETRKWGWLVLFVSASTLLCCALPILLVGLGMGAAMASLASNAPWLITISMYKSWTFTITGALLLLAAWALFRKGRYCPSDPELAKKCEIAFRWNRWLFYCSVSIWIIGLTTSYLLLPILEKLS